MPFIIENKNRTKYFRTLLNLQSDSNQKNINIMVDFLKKEQSTYEKQVNFFWGNLSKEEIQEYNSKYNLKLLDQGIRDNGIEIVEEHDLSL